MEKGQKTKGFKDPENDSQWPAALIVLSPPDRIGGVNKSLRSMGGNRVWLKSIREGNSQHTGPFLRDCVAISP